MEAAELRARQRPLKDAYRESPESARVPAHAEAVLDLSALTCSVRTPGGTRLAGMHEATGGSGDEACSADLLLESVVACAGVTMAAVATAMGVPIRSARITADGHWDARGTLGVDRDAPVGMTDVTVHVDLDTDADPATVARLVELTERYCVIAQTLRTPPSMRFELA